MFGLFKKNNGRFIDVRNIDNFVGNVELIDIREPYEFKSGSIRTAKNIPMNILINDTEKYLKKDKEYYILCQSGNRSSRTCRILEKQGYDVINVSGGMGRYSGANRKCD